MEYAYKYYLYAYKFRRNRTTAWRENIIFLSFFQVELFVRFWNFMKLNSNEINKNVCLKAKIVVYFDNNWKEMVNFEKSMMFLESWKYRTFGDVPVYFLWRS